jgi:hypothetical protein
VSSALAGLGLRPGERVRFRRPDRARWQEGVATHVERDGSLGVRDGDGAARAVPLDRVEVELRTARGARRWEPLLARAGRAEQLRLL